MSELAVFTRNHQIYLDEAVRRSAQDPQATTTFRARSPWVKAHRELPLGGSLPIYMAVIDGGGQVEYEGELCHVQLDPRRGAPETEALLENEPSLTKAESEGLWERAGKPMVRTLYAVRNCRRLARSFPMTSLVKLSDGKPISADYQRAYVVVRPHPRGT
jgi:hypothetical protein